MNNNLSSSFPEQSSSRNLEREKLDKQLEDLYAEWSELEHELMVLYRSRSKQTGELMKRAVSLFASQLFLSNQQPVPACWPACTATLSIKPVNLEERVEFICNNPAGFPAFRQLSNLIEELKKQYAASATKAIHCQKNRC